MVVEIIELQGVDNARDLGGIPVEGGNVVKRGLFVRGGALSGATESDCERLFGEIGVACVIDLRTGWERREKPDVEIAGVDYVHIPFYDLEKVGIEYTEPAKGTKVIGRDVACEPERFYRSLSNALTVRQMREGMGVAFSRALSGQPVYEHCSGGKDRAGVFALLILTVLGASRESILEDYLFTNVSRDGNFDKMLARFMRFSDGDEKRARELVHAHRALPENLDAFYAGIEARYGDMNDFVRNQLGIDDERRATIREACTCPLQDTSPIKRQPS